MISRRELVASIAAGLALTPASAETFRQSKNKPSEVAPPAAPVPHPIGAPLVAVCDYEQAALGRMTEQARAFISGGAADELTLRWNREAYDRIVLKPRVLSDLKALDTRVRLFGNELPFPILIAPTASHRLVHPEGEMATARGANTARVVMSLSSFSNTPVEEVAPLTKMPLWFQLYVQPDREFTKEQVRRAESAGCQAVVVTVDTTVGGARNREERARFSYTGLPLPHIPQSTRGDTSLQTLQRVLSYKLSWKDIEWLRGLTKMRVLIKGVLDPDDAAIAAREKLDGVIVSNHGGRNLDTAPATVVALPGIVEAVAGAMPVIVDGGVRRGTDVLKALALGATAVQIGRPYLYGLAVNGAEGVTNVVAILRREFEMAMALAGRDSISQIDKSVLWSS